MIFSRKDALARALFFVSSPTASGVQLPFETNWIWIFFRQAFCLSLPFFHAQEIDDWGPKFRFRLWWPLIDWLLSVVFGEGARTHWENNQWEEWNPQRRNGPVRTLGGHHFSLLSTGPYLHCITVHCLASSQRFLTSPRKGTTSFPSTKTERSIQGSPHNACIRLVKRFFCTLSWFCGLVRPRFKI